MAIALLPALAATLAIRLYRPGRLVAWWLFAAGLAVQAAGVLATTILSGPSLDPTAPPALLSSPAAMLVSIGSLLQLGGAYGIVRGATDDRWSALDAGIILAASAFAIWFLIVDPTLDAGAMPPVPVAGLLVILLIDALFVELGLRVLLGTENRHPAAWLFLGSLGSALVSQLAFTAQVASGTYVFGELTDLGRQVASVGWAVMALHPTMVRLAGAGGHPAGGSVPWQRILSLSLAALLIPVILVADGLGPGHAGDDGHLLVAGTASGLVLVMVVLRLGGAFAKAGRQQEALSASEERYRTLVEQSTDGIFVIDRDGQIVEVNSAAVALLGHRPSALVGRAWRDLIPKEDLAAHPLRFGELSPDRSMLFERRLERSDGTTAAVEISAKTLADGRILHVARDIGERLRAEEERARLVERLELSRRDLEEAQQIAKIGSWTLDPSTGDATWSREMYRILGLGSDGRPIGLADISGLFTPDSVRDVTAAVEHAVRTGEPWQLDLEVVRPDGSRTWLASNGIAEPDGTGAVTRIRGTMQDVTEQRRLESQLRQAQRLEAVGQLAGGIAHDFNNLLTAIRGYAELVRRKLASDDPNRADVDQVVLAADRAAELTGQLLAFSRRQVLQPQVLDPAAIVAGIAPLLRRLLGEHIALETHAMPGLGHVKVDPSQFEQVIVNLAVNARDAMPEGGRLTIETANVDLDDAYAAAHADVTPGPYVALVVSDTGIGMDAATQARIFEPFFTTKEPGKGTGMGLATVYGIVKQSGGSISVYSEPGHGSSFKVYLPRVAEDAARDAPARTRVADHGGSERILLAEDEGPVRTFAARVLADLGYTVLEATSGAEALAVAAASERPVDLLITDVIMPGLQGHQLAVQLAADRPDLRVLYVSGFTENSVIHHGVAADGVLFLPKPFTADALARAAREALDAPA